MVWIPTARSTAGPTPVAISEPPSAQQLALDARVEPLELDLAYDLIELVDGSAGGDLLHGGFWGER